MVNRVGRAKKRIEYKRKLKERRKMEKQENTKICITVDGDFFTAKLQLCKWFKDSFNLSLNEAKDEMYKVIECWKCDNKPPKYLFFKEVNPKEIDIDKLIMNSPKGISVSRENSEMQTVHSKEFDEISLHSETEVIDTENKVKPLTTTLFGEPIVMLRITKYNQMKLQLKEYSNLKQQSNNDAIKADKEIKRLQKLVDQYEKNANRYSKLRSLLETTLNQFK